MKLVKEKLMVQQSEQSKDRTPMKYFGSNQIRVGSRVVYRSKVVYY